MARVETLNEDEYQILEAFRRVTTSWAVQQRFAAYDDIKAEIEDVWNLLGDVQGATWEEDVREARDRLYRLMR